MPAPPIANTFEGGTDLVAITTGNSGGQSGDPCSAVTGGAATTFSATHVHNGGMAMQLTQPGVYAAMHATWTGFGIAGGANAFCRFYLWIPNVPAVATPCLRWITAAPATSAQLKINTTGTVQSANASTTGIVAGLGTIAVSTNQWIRIECRCNASTTVGDIEWRLYNDPDSTVLTETKVSGASQVLGADTGGAHFGNPGTTGHINESWWYDDIAVSSIDWIGPALLPPGQLRRFPLGV